MAGSSDPEAWWRSIQANDALEIFVMSDPHLEDAPRRKSKGRDDKTAESWRPCKVDSVEGSGARARALVSYTDISGKKVQDSILLKDFCGGRLRRPVETDEEKVKEDKAKSRKSRGENSDDVQGQASKVEEKPPGFHGFSESSDPFVGSRVKVLYDETDWYEGIIRCPGKKPGQYIVAFDQDEEKTTVNIPSSNGDVEVIIPKDELCERVKQLSENENSLLNRLLHRALVKSKCLKSNQGLPSPYSDLLLSVTSTVIRKIK